MGLDMYLSRNKYVSVYDFKKHDCKAKKVEIITKLHFADGDTQTQTEFVENPTHCAKFELPVAYWRKANQIHNYFVQECGNGDDNCKPIHVRGSQLKELVERCKKILDNPSLAKELLPTKAGFFFGSTDYDEYYMDDLKDTLEQLKDCDFDEDYTYNASW